MVRLHGVILLYIYKMTVVVDNHDNEENAFHGGHNVPSSSG